LGLAVAASLFDKSWFSGEHFARGDRISKFLWDLVVDLGHSGAELMLSFTTTGVADWLFGAEGSEICLSGPKTPKKHVRPISDLPLPIRLLWH
jgi:hypothetical protein